MLRRALPLVAWTLWAGMVSAAEPPVSKEYQIKAAFLYNFCKYIEWPVSRFASDTSPIVIGVLGDTPAYDELTRVVRGRSVNHRAIVVKNIGSSLDLTSAFLLFVPAGEETHLPAGWQTSGIVTVGESKLFASLGGTITFTVEDDKVRFAINLESSAESGVKISSQLLKLASGVHRKS